MIRKGKKRKKEYSGDCENKTVNARVLFNLYSDPVIRRNVEFRKHNTFGRKKQSFILRRLWCTYLWSNCSRVLISSF